MAWVPRLARVELPRPLEGRASRTLETTSTPWLAGRDLADQTKFMVHKPRGIKPEWHRAVQSSGIGRPGLRAWSFPFRDSSAALERQVNLENCTVA